MAESKRDPGRDRASKRRPRRTAGEGGDGSGSERPSAAVEWIRSIAVAVVLFLVIRTFLVQTFVITSGSMEDTLLVGDFLLVNRAAIGTRVPGTDVRVPGYSEPRRFDVLVFDPPHEPDLKLVKRLVGMPSDTLSMVDGVLFINGEAQAEPYVQQLDPEDEYHPMMAWQREYLAPGVDVSRYAPTRDTWGPLVVPPDHYFMLGDNRTTSLDSRYWGLLEAWRLEGRVSFIYFSYNRGSTRPFAALREVRWGRIGDGIE
jgi:signal peptidase I